MKKLSNKQVAQKVDWEGLGYCIESYFDGTEFKDKDLSIHWKAAKAHIEVINEILKKYFNYD